jgi:hypothetical protein
MATADCHAHGFPPPFLRPRFPAAPPFVHHLYPLQREPNPHEGPFLLPSPSAPTVLPLWNHRVAPSRPLRTPSRPILELRCSVTQLPNPVAYPLDPRFMLSPPFPRQPQALLWTAPVSPTPTCFSPQTGPPHGGHHHGIPVEIKEAFAPQSRHRIPWKCLCNI